MIDLFVSPFRTWYPKAVGAMQPNPARLDAVLVLEHPLHAQYSVLVEVATIATILITRNLLMILIVRVMNQITEL